MRTESRTTMAFGKVPDRGDFVRFNVKGPGVDAIETWMQKGLQVASNVSSFEATYGVASPFYFWFDAGASAGILAGTIHPSRDQVGREYPFLVAVDLERSQDHLSQLPRIPVRWNSYFDSAGRLAEAAVDGGLSFGRIRSRLKLLDSEVDEGSVPDEAYQQFLQETTLKQFFEQLWDAFDDPRKYVLFKNLMAIVLPLQTGVPARFPLALRFPLSRNIRARIFEVGLWLELCLRLLNTAELQPSFFWTASKTDAAGKPFLLLALRPPTARYFAYLFAGLSDDRLCDLDQMGRKNAADAAQALPGGLAEWLDSRTLPLEQLLERLSRSAHI